MSVRWDVLGMGVSAVDDLVYVDHYPEPDSKLPVKKALRQLGGVTAMALVAAARMGARAAYCSVLGDDDLSECVIPRTRGRRRRLLHGPAPDRRRAVPFR